MTSRRERLRVAALVGGFAAGYAVYAVVRHWHFDTSYDLAIYDQAIWHLSRFERPASSLRGATTIFGDHFHPVIALLAPLFWIAPSAETLLVAQAVLLAASIVPVYAYARDRLPPGPALALAAAYASCWTIQQTAFFDVHEAAFAPLAVAALLLAMERRRWGWFWAAAIFVLGVKEDMAPFLAWVGVYLIVRGDRRRGAVLVAGGLIAFAAIVGVLLPGASDSGEYGYRDTYSAAIRAPWLAPRLLVSPPIKLLTMALWVAPLALLPLASPLILLVVPFGLERFLSASPNHWGTSFHYWAPIAPIITMAAADGLARLAVRIDDPVVRRRTVAAFAGACVLFSSLLPGHQGLWRLLSPRTYAFGAIDRTGRDAIAVIPADASLVAQTAVAPHVSHRRDLFRLDSAAPDASYVVAALERSPWPNASSMEVRALVDARRAHGYTVVFERDGWIVLRR